MTIGRRLKIAIDNSNMSRTEVAEKANISKQTLYKYENEIVTNIPSDKIEALSRILNVSPAYLMGWDQEQIDAISKIQEDADAYDDAIEARIKQIADLNLSEAELEEVYNFAKYVLSKRKEG